MLSLKSLDLFKRKELDPREYSRYQRVVLSAVRRFQLQTIKRPQLARTAYALLNLEGASVTLSVKQGWTLKGLVGRE
jgi:hypothetical protein